MVKRIIAIILLMAICVSFCACGSENEVERLRDKAVEVVENYLEGDIDDQTAVDELDIIDNDLLEILETGESYRLVRFGSDISTRIMNIISTLKWNIELNERDSKVVNIEEYLESELEQLKSIEYEDYEEYEE